jgi:hypothetical protein
MRKKKYEIAHRTSLVIHTQKLLDNLLAEAATGKDLTVIINQRLNDSYKCDPVKP